ncbi:MAG: transcriptional regulator [Streptomycetales bacterium]
MSRLEASDIGPATLGGLDLVVDELCGAYPNVSPAHLLVSVQGYRRSVARLLDGRATLGQRRQLLIIAGWIMLLESCLHVDLGQRRAADPARRAARQLGLHAEHGEIAAWADEIGAWQALVDRRYVTAVRLCQAGQQQVSTETFAYVQLAAQEARAWARLGRPRETHAALARSAGALQKMRAPERPGHHFVFDLRKQVGYTATTLAWLGDDSAEAHAREAVGQYEREAAQGRSLRRLATARVDLALVVAREGPEEACHLGNLALGSGRWVPSNSWRVGEFAATLSRRHGRLPVVREFCDHYRETLGSLSKGPAPPQGTRPWR